jgi:hypothetical protein
VEGNTRSLWNLIAENFTYIQSVLAMQIDSYSP